MTKVILSLFFFIITIAAISQSNELPYISADRPGMATGIGIMSVKSIQIETGYSIEKFKSEYSNQLNSLFNTTLIRLGLNKNAELRVQSDYAGIKTDSSNIKGLNPLTIGSKLLITEGNSIIPTTSFLFNLTMPFLGKKDFRPSNPAPSAYLLMQNNITNNFSICYNAGIEYDGVTAMPAEFVAVCISYCFTEKLSGFVENYDYFSKETIPQTFLDAGFAFLACKNIQIDLSGNMDMNDIKNYLMANIGVSLRLPK